MVRAARRGDGVEGLDGCHGAGRGWVLYTQRQDIVRYLKIKQMSMGDGHPENVPAVGSQSYRKA